MDKYAEVILGSLAALLRTWLISNIETDSRWSSFVNDEEEGNSGISLPSVISRVLLWAISLALGRKRR
jgi:hypothetical protein